MDGALAPPVFYSTSPGGGVGWERGTGAGWVLGIICVGRLRGGRRIYTHRPPPPLSLVIMSRERDGWTRTRHATAPSFEPVAPRRRVASKAELGAMRGPLVCFFSLEKMGPLVCGSVENTIVLFNPVDPRELILWAAAVY